MTYKVGDRVLWNGNKWDIFLIWKDTSSRVDCCCLLNVLTGESVDTFLSSLKPIVRVKNGVVYDNS